MKKIIITIDGWSSCGKSTLAKQLAKALNYVYIDSGAMYRAIQSMISSFPILDYRCRFINIQVYDEFAVVNSFLNVSMFSALAADDDAYQVTDVWKKYNKEWKLVCRQPSLSSLIHG